MKPNILPNINSKYNKKALLTKIELIKIRFILNNKNNILEDIEWYKANNMNFNYYFKAFINKKKDNKIFLKMNNIFKNLKLFLNFLILGHKNFIVFNLIEKYIPGSYSNWYYNLQFFNIRYYNQYRNKNLFPNICIILNFEKNEQIYNYCYNELDSLKIYQIIIQNNFFFYKKKNKVDFFIPLNIQHNQNNFFFIFKFIKKFSQLLKIIFVYKEQFFYYLSLNNKIAKYIQKNTHYWTRTNTLKIIRTDFKSAMSTNSIK